MGGIPVRHSLCIMRLICTCGHTHAILPDFIIPYSGYGLSFLKALLTQTSYSDFASAFVRRFAKSFLQSHKNPAPYCQQVFGP